MRPHARRGRLCEQKASRSTAETWTVPSEPDEVLPSPTCAVPIEWLDVLAPVPTIEIGTVIVVPLADACGALAVEPTCVVPTDPLAMLPPAEADAGTAVATSAAAPMRMRRVMRPLPPSDGHGQRTAASAVTAEMRPKRTPARIRFAVRSMADTTRTLVALGCAATMIPARPATSGVADESRRTARSRRGAAARRCSRVPTRRSTCRAPTTSRDDPSGCCPQRR